MRKAAEFKLDDFLGETTLYDKKLTLEERKPKSWLKSISAFANGDGGILFFGISDEDELRGLQDVKRASEKISELIKERMDPVPKVSLKIYRRDGKDFIIVFDDRMEIYSPGGMLDGSLVQNLDTDAVASKRRNPIIADLFSRMNLMERRGSGFKKIKGDYKQAHNYRAELAPKFKSTATSFFVTLYNLNYNVPIEKVAFDEGKVDFGSEKVAFGEEKIDFEPEKVDFEPEKVDFEVLLEQVHFSNVTKQRMRALYDSIGSSNIFTRKTILKIMNLSPTYASNLISKMKQIGIIEIVLGQGKGRYKFKKFEG